MNPENLKIIKGGDVEKHLQSEELEKLVHAWMSDLYPVRSNAEKTREDVRRIIKPLNEVIAHGDMIIAQENGKTVGMIKVNKLDSLGPKSLYAGKEIYEIGKASVLPEMRGRGIYRKLREKIVEHIKAKYGEVYILSTTKNEAVKKVNREMEWEEIGYLEYLRIHNHPEEKISAQNTPEGYIQKEGWTAFIYKPSQN